MGMPRKYYPPVYKNVDDLVQGQRPRFSYEEIELFVCDYQEGKEGASDRLVGAFEGYLVKFLNLLNKGQYSPKDPTLRRFVRLYASPTRVGSTINLIREEFSRYERDEIKAELVTCFLNMAQQYRSWDGKPRFHTKIARFFHFRLHQHLEPLISDVLTYANGKNVLGYDENSSYTVSEGESVEGEFTRPIEHEGLYVLDDALEADDSYLDENWVNGFSCSEVFADLTPLDRRVLKMRFVARMNDQQIADALGVCRATVNRRLKQAEQSIYAAAEVLGRLRSDDAYMERVKLVCKRPSQVDKKLRVAKQKLKRWTSE